MKQKLQRSEMENLAGNYFVSQRANTLLTMVHRDVHRATRKWKGKTSKTFCYKNTVSLFNV